MSLLLSPTPYPVPIPTPTPLKNQQKPCVDGDAGKSNVKEFSPWFTWWAGYLTNYLTTAWWKLSSMRLKAETRFQKTNTT